MKTFIDSHKLSDNNINSFFYAGKAIVTLRNTKTGNRYTYKITKAKNKDIFFINVFTGNDNTNKYHYKFIGTIFDKDHFKYSTKSEMLANAMPVKVMEKFPKFVMSNKLPNDVEVWHEGFCGCCGRRLTVPESLLSGIGPECNKKRWKEAQKQLALTVVANPALHLATRNIQTELSL